MKRTNGLTRMLFGRAISVLLVLFIFLLAGFVPARGQTCAHDQTLDDFILGTTGTNTAVVMDGDGAVILKPGYNEDFSGSSIPSGWDPEIFGSGTPPVFNGGLVNVDGSHISYLTSFVDGTALEFSATFTAGNFQNVGISTDAAFNAAPWIVVGRGGNPVATDLYARVNDKTDILLGSNLLNSRHTFKIKRNGGVFEFYVDGAGTPAATHPVPSNTGSNMYIQISDVDADGAVLSVDWIRVTPYAPSGSYTSRVFGNGSNKRWGAATWDSDLASGTGISVFVSTGGTAEPDGSWTPFAQIMTSGAVVRQTASYIRYRADLVTSNTLFTPVLKNLAITCLDPAVNTAPVVTLDPVARTICQGSSVSFTSDATGVPDPTVIRWESSPDGSAWTPIPASTGSTYTFTAAALDNGIRYRAIWDNGVESPVASAPALLTVSAPLKAAIEAVHADVCQGDNIELRLSSTVTNGSAPYLVVVDGVSYTANSLESVFATFNIAEHTIWPETATPSTPTATDYQPIELGVKFRSSVDGYIKGIRFYNGNNNSGTHLGHIWAADGTLLAEASFINVSTYGWQEVRFVTPVSITANTTYTASYYASSGFFASTSLGLSTAVNNPPLTALASGTDGPNGVYKYEGGFPNTGASSTNYFVDVIFSETGNNPGTFTYYLNSITDANGCTLVGAPNINSVTVAVNPAPSGTLAAVRPSVYEGEEYELAFNATSGAGTYSLQINDHTYTNVQSGTTFTAGTATYLPPPASIWPPSQVGGTQTTDNNATTLGLRFRSSVPGTISGIRFYKHGTDVLNFTVSLWAFENTTALATASYTSDNTPGWKQVDFTTPVPIDANITYIASYYTPVGYYYAHTNNYSFPKTSIPFTALGSSYVYNQAYPGTLSTANYWVDVVFNSPEGVTNFVLYNVTNSSGCSSTASPVSSAFVVVNQARVWTGSTSSEWSNTANWSTGVVPGEENVVVPEVTTGNYYPVVSGLIAVNDLIIRPLASMTIDAEGALTVKGALTVSGDLVNPGTLTIKSSLTLPDLTPSGSLIVRGTSAGNVTYERQFKEYADGVLYNNFDWHYFSSPVGSNSNANTAKVSAVYSYNEVTDTWPVASMTALDPGKGYNLDQTANSSSDELLTFTGNVVRSAFPIEATSPYANYFDGSSYDGRSFAAGRDNNANYGGGGWNLLGNPFTSAMNVSAFIDSNNGDNLDATDGYFDPNYEALYVYDGSVGTTGEYSIYTEGAIQAGQGFFVLAMNNGVYFSFTPADATSLNMQVHNTSAVLLKSAKAEDPWPGLELKVKYGSGESKTSVLYHEIMTPGLDPGYDIGQLSAGPAVEIYTALAAKDNGVNFARQALPASGADTIVVPVGIDSEKGGEVTFSATTVPIGSNKFWLEDKTAGTFTDLTTKSYTVTLPAETYGTGRFFIIASTNTPTAIEKPQAEDTGLRIWTSYDKVIISGDVSDKAICEVYNVAGKKILDVRLTGRELNTVNLPSGSKGVFIVRVVDGLKVTTRKVALF